MKLTRRILIFSILTAVLSAIGFGFTFRAAADQWFDQYPKIPWEHETVRLKNLNHFLKNNPETIGWIIYQWANKGEKKEMRLRANHARRYLIHELKLDQSRIVVIDGKQASESGTILQPVPNGSPLLRF